MSVIGVIVLAAFAICTILFALLRLDSRIIAGSVLVLLVVTVIAVAMGWEDVAQGVVLYAYGLLISAVVVLTVEYLRGEPEKRVEGRREQTQGELDHK